MNESILTSIKKLLGIAEDYTNFDQDIIIHINTVFVILKQLGVENDSFSISGNESVWGDYLTDGSMIEMIKSYIYLRVKLLFDPPSNNSYLEAIKEQINEYEWRINMEIENV